MNRPVALFLATELLNQVHGTDFAIALDCWIVDSLLENEPTEEISNAAPLSPAT